MGESKVNPAFGSACAGGNLVFPSVGTIIFLVSIAPPYHLRVLSYLVALVGTMHVA